jgi:glycosyltransferase involved in cell wall biosynthesis
MASLTIIMALSAVGWSIATLVAMRRVAKGEYRLGPADEPAVSAGLVSIIIPARNEVNNIANAVNSVLASDYDALELIVLDDGSTDGTAEVLADIDDPRLRVMSGGDAAIPSNWFGKPWACHRAAQEANGVWLLFIDADVSLAPEAVSRAIGYAQASDCALLSGFGRLAEDGEQFIQPVIAGMVVAGNPLSQVNDPENRKRVVANGQFMLFSKSGYDAVGGHTAVARNVLDDVGLAHAIVEADQRLTVLMMQQLFSVRMYGDWRETWRGWRKNLFPGMQRSWATLFTLLIGSSLFLLGPYVVAVLGIFGLVSTETFIAAACAVGAIQVFRFYLDGVFRTARLAGQYSHFVANAAVLCLLIDSAISTTRGSAVWKGRVITRPEE